MAAIKVEPDAHEEPEPVSSELEYQPNDADPIPMTFRFVKWDGKQEEPCDVTTIKEEVKNEIKTEDHKGCLDRSYSTEEVTLTVANGKEEVKGETSTEDHEVCVDRIEELLIKEEHETVSSETDVTECLDCEWDCPVETDPLHSEANSGSSCILSQCSDNEENKGHKCELRKHTSDKSFICEICKKNFKKRRILVAHIRIHSGEKPFKCDLCNKSFSRRNNLKAHSRVHTGERPYKCDVCNKCFAVRCGLDIHSRIHTGEKPFKCEVCHKTFRQVSNLSHHSRTHTGEKPFKCEVCYKRFTRSSHLIAHSHLHARDRT